MRCTWRTEVLVVLSVFRSFLRYYFFLLLLLLVALSTFRFNPRSSTRKKKKKIKIKYLEFSRLFAEKYHAHNQTPTSSSYHLLRNLTTQQPPISPSCGVYILFSSMNCCSVVRAYRTYYSYSPIVRWHNYPLSFSSGCETRKTCLCIYFCWCCRYSVSIDV